jgi:hypothetical protein
MPLASFLDASVPGLRRSVAELLPLVYSALTFTPPISIPKYADPVVVVL